jgi:hypothetical protein
VNVLTPFLLPLLLPEHGLGGAQDLPISRELAILGAAAAVAVSFVVLALAWRTPRYDETAGRPAPIWLAGLVDSAVFRGVLRAIGVIGLLYLVLVALAGKDLLTNPIFGIFYVWIWVGMVPASLLFGRVWKAISPWRLINTGLARVTGAEPDDGLYPYPERLGTWPGAFGLFAFVWFELVDTHNIELGQVTLWCAVYLAAMVVGGALFGNTFYARADPFEVYSSSGVRRSTRSASRRAGWSSSRATAPPSCCRTPWACSASAPESARSSGSPASRPLPGRGSPAGACPGGSRTRWCRSSSATSWPTT